MKDKTVQFPLKLTVSTGELKIQCHAKKLRIPPNKETWDYLKTTKTSEEIWEWMRGEIE